MNGHDDYIDVINQEQDEIEQSEIQEAAQADEEDNGFDEPTEPEDWDLIDPEEGGLCGNDDEEDTDVE